MGHLRCLGRRSRAACSDARTSVGSLVHLPVDRRSCQACRAPCARRVRHDVLLGPAGRAGSPVAHSQPNSRRFASWWSPDRRCGGLRNALTIRVAGPRTTATRSMRQLLPRTHTFALDHHQHGGDLVEYGIIIATIAVVVLLGVTTFGSQIRPWFEQLAGHITTVGT